MKKVFTIALLVLLLALIGCTAREGNYSSALTEYFERIAKQEYFEAYALLSPAAQRRIERDEFINKHKAIYEEIGVRSISIRDFELTYTEMVAFITYTLEYECEDIGVFTGSYRMALSRVDGEWRVDWTPALIFPEMDWGDTVRVRSITAKRGEIFAGDLPLAINVNATSVFASKQAIEDIDYLCDAAAPILNMSVSDVRKNWRVQRRTLWY